MPRVALGFHLGVFGYLWERYDSVVEFDKDVITANVLRHFQKFLFSHPLAYFLVQIPWSSLVGVAKSGERRLWR